MIKKKIKAFLNGYIKRVCRKEYELQQVNRLNERPVEFEFVFRKLSKIYPKNILDIGTGTTALPHLMRNCGFHVTATDNIKDYWPSGMFNRHYHIINDDITFTKLNRRFDFITCISVLEHIEKHEIAFQNMINLLNANGYLLLTFPYNEKSYVQNTYDLPGSTYGQDFPYITQSFSRKELSLWLKNTNTKIIDQEFWQFWSGDFWTVGSEVIPPKKVSIDEKHQLTCLLFKKNEAKKQ